MNPDDRSPVPGRRTGRMLQIRLPFFMLAVAGAAVAAWGWRFRGANVDAQRSFLDLQVAELSRGDATHRLVAAESLGGGAGHLAVALPALINAAGDPDARVRRAVADSLGSAISGAATAREGRIGPEIDAATPSLVGLLADRDAAVRESAALALGKLRGEFTPPFRAAVAAGTVKVKVVRGVPVQPAPPPPVAYGPDPRRVVPALEIAARDPEPRVRIASISILGRIAPKGEDFPPVLLSAFLDDPAPGVRQQATMALCQPWKNADALWSPLVQSLMSEDNLHYGTVGQSLPDLGTPPASALPALMKALATRSPGADHALPIVLGRLGPPARAALPTLLEIAAWEPLDPSGRFSSAEAIAAIDPASTEARAVLPMIVERARRLRSWNGYRYEQAGTLIARFGPSASAAVPGLVDAMKEESDPYTRVQIGAVLASIKPGSKAALQALAEMARGELRHATPERFIATQAILDIDPASPEALSLLLPLARVMVETNSDADRVNAGSKIRWMAGVAGPALPMIRREMFDIDPDGRRAARALMEKIEDTLRFPGGYPGPRTADARDASPPR